MSEMPLMVTIKKNVFPDIQVIATQKSYNDNIEFVLLSFVKSEMVIVQQECDEAGTPTRSYRGDQEFIACRLIEDIIEVCDSKLGWIPAADELNSKYKNTLADKELVGG